MLHKNQINKLQKLQNKCIQLIDPSTVPVLKKYSEHRILKVEEIIELELCKIAYKVLKDELPSRIKLALITDSRNKSLEKTHNYGTHFKRITNVPKLKNKAYTNSFLMKSMKLIQPFLAITNGMRNIKQFVGEYKKSKFDIGYNK